MKQSTHNQGFVILFAVLISSIILLIGVGMFRISIKETILSSTARESTAAFFIADAGIECALYADVKLERLTESGGNMFVSDCSHFQFRNNAVTTTSSTQMNIRLRNDNNMSCVHIEIEKDNTATTIISRGYNVCNMPFAPAINNPLILERQLFIQYSR